MGFDGFISVYDDNLLKENPMLIAPSALSAVYMNPSVKTGGEVILRFKAGGFCKTRYDKIESAKEVFGKMAEVTDAVKIVIGKK